MLPGIFVEKSVIKDADPRILIQEQKDNLGKFNSEAMKSILFPYLNPKAQERTGYPTQKPILLLERIIRLGTDKGDLVLDPFCGSGTTLVAASLLGRNSIGIDISEGALSIAQSRLANPIKTNSPLLQKGRKAYQTANEYALVLLDGLDFVPVQRNKGIDAILREQIGNRPVPIRVQRHNETLSEAASALYYAGQTKYAKVMILVASKMPEDPTLVSKLPPEIVLVRTPAETIRQEIIELRERLEKEFDDSLSVSTEQNKSLLSQQTNKPYQAQMSFDV
jgi:site-specific DNA-methyltransferase (adenine-specific)